MIPCSTAPYDPPTRHFEVGPKGPTGTIVDGRRPSESFIPIAPVKERGRKPADAGQQLALTLTHEVVQPNTLINELRLERAVHVGRQGSVGPQAPGPWTARQHDLRLE